MESSCPIVLRSSCAFTTRSYWRQPQDASSLAIPSGLMATRLTHDGSKDIGAKFIKTGEMQQPKLIRLGPTPSPGTGELTTIGFKHLISSQCSFRSRSLSIGLHFSRY